MPILSVVFLLIAPKIPVADGFPKRGPVVGIALLLFLLGACSIGLLLPAIDWNDVIRPSSGAKLAILSVAITVLVMKLANNLEAGERRTQFQRLETELTLSKIDLPQAKDRYENLMLGMSVSVALRPFVDSVMLPLDEAHACVSEVKQLLVRFQEARNAAAGEHDSTLDVAVEQRAVSLLEAAKKHFLASGKAYGRLKGVTYANFGEKDIAKTPISSENERINEARRRFEDTFREVATMVDSLSPA